MVDESYCDISFILAGVPLSAEAESRRLKSVEALQVRIAQVHIQTEVKEKLTILAE